ncbi:hypothetical protein BDV95DRAFT_484887 [Massariosphaeria phaeospora]|uniref:Tyrosine specific protein phosphatases domain-containing protein n=1 Tax=Massariosphaeria phaeospora TaxID=100035 RepID=A0A7C8MEY3_9PLEO|nr:hypothetical protein BDV95DRAFT_484887 [Massariosphaeria phaeospora]
MEPHSRPCPSPRHGTFQLPQALVLLLSTALADSSHHAVAPAASHADREPDIKIATRLLALLNPFLDRRAWTTSVFVGMVELTALCGIGSALWLWSKRGARGEPAGETAGPNAHADDAAASDPGLLKKHSTLKSYTVSSTGFTYPAIRTFYRPHPQQDKLPNKPSPLPLLVFIHGLGGSAAQFHPILISLSNLASCLAIDLPGCGLSSVSPTSWEAYTTDALTQLLAVVIEAHRNRDEGQNVVLIGHSMGCSLAALLASSSSPNATLLSDYVSGIIAICPKADPPTEKQQKTLKTMTSIPGLCFDLMRRWDRRGGINSKSVLRMAGSGADEETRKLQLRFNQQSRTEVWRRMSRGMIGDYSKVPPKGGLPGREVWSGLQIPVFLAAGEADEVTPVENVRRIVQFLGRDVAAIEPPSEKAGLPIAAAPFDPAMVDPELDERKHQDSGIDARDFPCLEKDAQLKDDATESLASTRSTNDSAVAPAEPRTDLATVSTPSSSATTSLPNPHPRRLVLKTAILPAPASHALLFAPSTTRPLAGLITHFLATHIDPRLSLGWQLTHLSTSGKWDVKNLAKWAAVVPVSEPIANTFHALKTLREVDETHSPKVFVKQWAGKLSDVIDISHDAPVYDPAGLSSPPPGLPPIRYHKFPTVSKQPPTVAEVASFIALIDGIRAENKAEGRKGLLGVHCHYGFNRTGFFLVSYLVERLGFRVEDAIEAFGRARAPGVRHQHFVDALHVRYCVGLRKAPTL